MNYLIGCSGWQFPEWEYKFYPKNLAKTDWLTYYANIFPTVEINYSFYRTPTEKTLKKWYNQVPPYFRYTLKANRIITHYRNFKNTEWMLKDFYALTDVLEEKLGCILFQLPSNTPYSDELFDKMLAQMDASKHNAIEFHHESWFSPKAQEKIKNTHLIFCTPALPEGIISTNGICYVRFHGKKDGIHTEYNSQEIKNWATKIAEKQPKEIWAYFNNDINANAPKDAKRLINHFNKISNIV